MKYLLASIAISAGLTGWAWHHASRAGDNIGAIALPILGAGVTVGLLVVYVGLAFWTHRFL